ncbi:MAG: ThuA domain-containing protein [Pseudomonadota bacterium]
MSGPIPVHFVAAGKFHDIDFARLEILKLLAEEPRIRTTVACDFSNMDRLAECGTLITYTCVVLPTEEETAALKTFLERGGRWLALHGTNSILEFLESGLVSCPETADDFMSLLGTQFKAHPPIGQMKVEVTDKTHPMTLGIEDFETVDELYLSKTKADIDVLMKTRFTGEATGFEEADWDESDVPILYTRDHGTKGGGVLYNTLGHCRGHYDVAELMPFWPHPERCSWDYPVYYELLRRGIRWAIGELE